MSEHDLPRQWFDQEARLSRRDVLRGAGVGGLALAGSSLLAACGSSGATSTAEHLTVGANTSFAANEGTPAGPSKGGNLRVAMLGAGSGETYNIFMSENAIDILHASSVFDWMIRPAPYGRAAPGLVTKWTHNKDATEWELTLRDGVTWHDGTPLVPEDLIYSLRYAGAPTSLGTNSVAQLQLADLKKVGKNIIRVPLKLPIADLPGYFLGAQNAGFVIKDGTKSFTKPIGTGPFKLESFVAGQRSVLTANRDYWDSPRPYPDQLEILSIDDPTARINALQAGQVDISLFYPPTQAKADLSSTAYKVVVATPGSGYVIYMRCDSGPFRDVRVRQAMKLIADRPQLIDSALSGFGVPGNDLMNPLATYYDKSLPVPTQDIEKAKSLLKAAGASDLTVTLQTAEFLPGVTSAATVFAQQAAAAGVTINVKTDQVSQYLDPQTLYLKLNFGQDAWPSSQLPYLYSALALKDSPLNETHWESDSFDQLFYKAQAATDPTQAQDLWNQLQSIQYHQGGYIVWGYWSATDAASHRVRGFGGPGSGAVFGADDFRVWNWGLA